MKAHEVARILAAGPDVEVAYLCAGTLHRVVEVSVAHASVFPAVGGVDEFGYPAPQVVVVVSATETIA